MKLNQSECSIPAAHNHFAWPDRKAFEPGGQVRFNDALENLTQKVLFKGTISFKKELGLFRESSLSKNDPVANTIEGNVLDLLILGMFWNEYHTLVPKYSKLKRSLLVSLIHLNSQNRRVGTKLEILRGKEPRNNAELKIATEVSLEQFNALSGWLLTQKEFHGEAERIQLWGLFFEFYPKAFFESLFPRIIAFSQWFMQEANSVLGENYQSLSQFDETDYSRFPEKVGSVTFHSNRALYYLNLVGSSIFNRAERCSFESTRYKSVVLPSCMIKKQNCQAMVIDNIRYCGHCTSNCPVSLVTRKMNSQGIETVVMEQDGQLFKRLNKYLEKKHSGVVLASNSNNSLENAFTMKKEGIVSQIVGLDQVWAGSNALEYNGGTNVSVHRLVKIVQ